MSETRIIDAILGDAHREAGELLQKAKDDAQASREAALEAARQRAARIADTARRDGEEIRRRAMLGAELAARKNALAARRGQLDKAFDNAYAALCALPDSEYAALLTKLAGRCAETGRETLLVPPARLACCEKLLPALNETMKKTGRDGALKAAASEAVKGGVRFVGETADIDCSFASLVRAARDEKETEIYKLLFGEKE
ncbi:MAG: V-type ATP synthase subunit E family protein [Oscillospiraceae bacterium]|nr:V-type ATP synthase subunit E family protein [Oscillospiraceae bacterium]